MPNVVRRGGQAAALIVAISLSALAHHSISVDYDTTKAITLTGKVTRIEWRNPHAFVHVDAEERSWAIELGSVNSLIRMGWTQNSIKIKDVVAVQGIRAIDGRPMVLARTVTLPVTGERLLTWEGNTAPLTNPRSGR